MARQVSNVSADWLRTARRGGGRSWRAKKALISSLASAVIDVVTANLVLIVLGSTIFAYFVVQTGMAQSVVKSITAIGLSPLSVMLLLIAFYVFLGCFLEGIGMVLVTVPVLLPLVLSTGYDPIWFGVLLVIVVEIGLIHPPVGMNLFVIRTQAPEISLGAMYRGVVPFLIAPFVLIAILLAWPDLALWLPRSMSLN